jgi:K(+)-stimulated pyrophosphate-energized sodium pump
MIKVMNLVSLLVLPAVLTLRHSDVRYAIAGVALVVLLAAVAFSKRKAPAMDIAIPVGDGAEAVAAAVSPKSGVAAAD